MMPSRLPSPREPLLQVRLFSTQMCPGLQPLHVCDLLVGQRAVGPVRRKGPFGRRRRRQVVNAAMTDRAVPSPHAPSVAPRGPARRTSTRADDHSIAELGFPTNAMGNTSAVAPAAISAVPVDCTSAIDLGSALSSSLPNCRDARPDANRLDQCRAGPRYHSCGGDVGQFDRWRFLFEAATGQLRWAGKLLQTRASDDMRAPMLDYDAADRCFQCALRCADHSKSWPVRRPLHWRRWRARKPTSAIWTTR